MHTLQAFVREAVIREYTIVQGILIVVDQEEAQLPRSRLAHVQTILTRERTILRVATLSDEVLATFMTRCWNTRINGERVARS
jgi:hypothetical protein